MIFQKFSLPIWLSIFMFLLNISVQSQITYEKGYFIDNSGNKTECLIRNVDWMKNPDSFQYKLSENEDAQTGNLTNIQEFGVIGESKFIRATVNIDRSSQEVDKLTLVREPSFSNETLFLMVLVKGKATLYKFEDSFGANYFYKVSDGKIEPLVFKKYITRENRIGENVQYKQQLFNAFNVQGVTEKELSKLAYREKSLTSFFQKVNNESSIDAISYSKETQKKWINIILRPGIHYSSVNLEVLPTNTGLVRREFTFENKLSPRVGVEIEAVMPFNKNKWAVTAEPFFETYKSELPISASQTLSIDYKYFGLGLGIRHYLFLNDNSKLFINASGIFAIDSGNSNIDIGPSRPIEKGSTVAAGLGFAYNNRFFVEFRHTFDRQLLKYVFQNAQYSGQSLILGYRLF